MAAPCDGATADTCQQARIELLRYASSRSTPLELQAIRILHDAVVSHPHSVGACWPFFRHSLEHKATSNSPEDAPMIEYRHITKLLPGQLLNDEVLETYFKILTSHHSDLAFVPSMATGRSPRVTTVTARYSIR